MVFGSQNESKIIQKSIEKVIEDKMHFRMAFWWLLVGFGVPFWGQGGSKMVSRGSQDGLKSPPKKCSPPLFLRFGDMRPLGSDFGGSWVLLGGVLGGSWRLLEGFWVCLGAFLVDFCSEMR